VKINKDLFISPENLRDLLYRFPIESNDLNNYDDNYIGGFAYFLIQYHHGNSKIAEKVITTMEKHRPKLAQKIKTELNK